LTRYIPHNPQPKQAAFLLLRCLEALYGGAAGGGKSDALLMAALQYVDVPGYSALLLRRTYPELKLPGGLLDRAKGWLRSTPARYVAQDHSFLFPTSDPAKPARLTFGYCQDDRDLERYASAEFQFVGIDEATQFTERQFRFFFSRLRKGIGLGATVGVDVPLRLRAASNPGGVGHDWIRARFVRADAASGRVFIPATYTDNRFLDPSYLASLERLDPVLRARLLEGDWDVEESGDFFHRKWIRTFWTEGGEYVLQQPSGQNRRVPVSACLRFATVDLAASRKVTADYTVISTFARTPENELLHLGQIRDRMEKADQVAALWRALTAHNFAYALVEAVAYQLTFVQDGLRAGLPVREVKPDGNKRARFTQAATFLMGGRYYVLDTAPWREALETELVRVDGSDRVHDDQADALAYATAHISSAGIASASVSAARRDLESGGLHARAVQAARMVRGRVRPSIRRGRIF
jgi:predicted phage terminase large subunit-like protein